MAEHPAISSEGDLHVGFEPDNVDIKFAGGTFIKEYRLHRAGTSVEQHSHSYPHMSVIVRGAVRLYENMNYRGDYQAPSALLIKANVEHQFVTLVPDTIMLCVHDAERFETEEGIT